MLALPALKGLCAVSPVAVSTQTPTPIQMEATKPDTQRKPLHSEKGADPMSGTPVAALWEGTGGAAGVPVPAPEGGAAVHTATNYDKWDMLDLSDDEDVSDCHPNIDGKLWLRLKKEKQHRKWEEEDAEMYKLDREQEARKKKMEDVTAEIGRRQEAGFGDAVGALQEQIGTIAGEMEAAAKKRTKMEERATWRSSEVATVADGELVTPARVALDRQEEIAELPLAERMAKAEEGKTAGTALFKASKWDEAQAAYSDGFDYVRLLEHPYAHPQFPPPHVSK